MSVVRVCATAAVLLVQVSCGPPAIEGGFDSANPAAKMYAIEYAARNGDQAAVRQIIEELNSDDPAVRMMAIGALERLTGQTFGYHHFDPPDQRRAAIQEWIKALQSGTIGMPPEITSPAEVFAAPETTPLPPPACTPTAQRRPCDAEPLHAHGVGNG